MSEYISAIFGILLAITWFLYSSRKLGLYSLNSLFPISLIFLQSIPFLLRRIYLGDNENYSLEINLVLISLVSFVFGSYLGSMGKRKILQDGKNKRERIALKWIGSKGILIFFIPCIYFSLKFAIPRLGTGAYGYMAPLSTFEQIFFYGHLLFLSLYLASFPEIKNKKTLLLLSLVILPRFIVSSVYGRFYILQGLIPIFYYGSLRAVFLRNRSLIFNSKLFLFGGLLFVVIFLGFIREFGRSNSFGFKWLIELIAYGGTINILKMHEMFIGVPKIKYLLASVFFKVFPFLTPSSYEVNVWGKEGVVATLDRVLSAAQNRYYGVNYLGTASNYIQESYLDGGILLVIIISLLLGIIARKIDMNSANNPLLLYVACEIVPRFLLLPRSNVGYPFERVPWLILIYLVIIGILLRYLRPSKKRKLYEYDYCKMVK